MNGRVSNTSWRHTQHGTESSAQVSTETLLGFGRALGGEPETASDLPFTGGPGAVYLRHDERAEEITSDWLAAGDHVAVCSGRGTGKTALRTHLVEAGSDDRIVAAVESGTTLGRRQLCDPVLQAAHSAGCGIDPENYWQVDQGVPWQTQELQQAVWEATANVRKAGKHVVLVVDDCDRLTAQACTQLQTLASSGVQLFLLGTHMATPVVETLAGSLGDRLQYLDGLEPFDRAAVGRYVSETLAQFGTTETPRLFTDEVVEYITTQTGGNPRAVRELCLALFVRAASLWQDLDITADRVTITPALVTQRQLRPA